MSVSVLYPVSEARQQLIRQVSHWQQASERLGHLDDLASEEAWKSLENYLNLTLRIRLGDIIQNLHFQTKELRKILLDAHTPEQIALVENRLNRFRRRYSRAELTVDFFADALNTRASPRMSAFMRACDQMGAQSIQQVLQPLQIKSPPVLTYIDKGLGASILKAGLRLWDGGTINPVAAIKVVRHNLLRTTALVHEAGHQVAHLTGWNLELAQHLNGCLNRRSQELANTWSGWSSEIAADVYAFVHTGFASIAALHDVVSGESRHVFQFFPGAPHPISYLRVLLGTHLCRTAFGNGPWDALESAWIANHPLERLDSDHYALIRSSVPALPEIARVCLYQPMEAFRGASISALVNPDRVHPRSLAELEKKLPDSGNYAQGFLREEALRLLALNGYQIVLQPHRAPQYYNRQERMMLQLGNL